MRFANLKGNFRRPETIRLLKWLLGIHQREQPRSPSTGVAVPFVVNDGATLKEPARDSLTWIGHASFLMQLGGKNLMIDPVLSNRLGWIRRNVLPGLEWAALPKIDLVLITHNHRDHMDAATLKRLGPRPLYVVPQGLGKWFRRAGMQRIVEMAWWQQQKLEGIDITFVPAEHWARRNLFDLNTSWWGGYVVRHNDLRLYHSGDTGWFDGFEMIGERCGSLDVAMLPIGAYSPRWFMKRQHIDPHEAVEAFKALNARHFVAMHWGTFKLSDEPLDAPPQVLRTAWEAAGLPESRLNIPAIGETLLLDSLVSEAAPARRGKQLSIFGE